MLPALVWTGCQTPSRPRPNPEPVRRSQPLLGTFVTITAYGAGRDAVQRAVTAAFDEFRRVDALMSIHRPDSELSRVNATAAERPVRISPELAAVLAKALEISRETDGAFDVTVRPLLDAWGFILKEPRMPGADELRGALQKAGFASVELNETARTVRFLKPGVSIDLGGIAKGYAVDRAVERLVSLGITNAMVKAGGDLRVNGAPPGAAGWAILLEDPRKQGQRTSIVLRQGALSTSGNYENYLEVNGRRYSHILDPRTGWPVQGIAACTVTAPSAIESDAWATACFVMGVERSLARYGGRFGIRFTLPPAPGAKERWPVRSSSGFPNYRRRDETPVK